MSSITIESNIGSEANEICRIIARELNFDFVDRIILSQIAKKMGSTVTALVENENYAPSKLETLSKKLQNILDKSPIYSVGGDAYTGPGIENILSKTYVEIEQMPLTSAVELDEKKFISSVNEVVNDLADIAKVVILGRGAGVILKDRKKVLRIAINLDKENRIKNLIKLNNSNFEESQRTVSNSDEAQKRYFNRAFNCSPFDPNMYHMIYNKSLFTVEELAMNIIKLYKDFINSEIYKNA
tara:strand:+ start:788 stop:1510 length:723 start_codon:yes stop_codon:yes gene_type:complete